MTGRRNFTRKSGFRDARLIIIAAEGEETEKIYFNGLKEYYENPHVHVEFLKRLESASDPSRVLKLLDKFCSTYSYRNGYDQLWLVIDVDRWGNQKLSSISQLCMQKGYQMAVSNPAFEIWLLLHVCSLDIYSPDILNDFQINRKSGNRTRLEHELITRLGTYNKNNLDMEFFSQRVQTAINNAQIADTNLDDRWPNQLGTRVYLLAKEIIPAEVIG